MNIVILAMAGANPGANFLGDVSIMRNQGQNNDGRCQCNGSRCAGVWIFVLSTCWTRALKFEILASPSSDNQKRRAAQTETVPVRTCLCIGTSRHCAAAAADSPFEDGAVDPALRSISRDSRYVTKPENKDVPEVASTNILGPLLEPKQ